MKKIFLILLSLYCAFISISCGEDYKREPSDVAIFITPPKSTPVVINSGEKYPYHLELYTTSDYIQRLCITSFDQVLGNIILKDTTWNQPVNLFDFVYTAPYTNRDSLVVKLTFTAWDNTGHQGINHREIIIINKQILSNEMSGITLWDLETGQPNALFLTTPSNPFNQNNVADSIKADLAMETDPEFENVCLTSQTGVKFVRNNNFDYAAATSISIQAVYESSRHDSKIENLRTNDIILVGHDTKSKGVFLVTNIIRTGVDNERCIQLSFKGITPL